MFNIKDSFRNGVNSAPDKVRIASFDGNGTAKGIARQSFRDYKDPAKYKTEFAIYRMNSNADTDGEEGVILRYDDLVKLAEILPALIESGEICPYLTKQEYDAAVQRRDLELARTLQRQGFHYIG